LTYVLQLLLCHAARTPACSSLLLYTLLYFAPSYPPFPYTTLFRSGETGRWLARRRDARRRDHAPSRRLDPSPRRGGPPRSRHDRDRKSTRLNSSHQIISYAVFWLQKKRKAKRSSQGARTHKLASAT